jgi:uncharacterized protein (DUF1330 family)
MNRCITVGLALVAGIGIGGVAVQGLHAQAKPPVYVVAEIDVTNQDAFLREYASRFQPLIRANGGRILAAASGQSLTAIEGTPPKPRVAIQAWDSLEKFQAYYNSAAVKELRAIGDKYATFRIFTLEGLPQ